MVFLIASPGEPGGDKTKSKEGKHSPKYLTTWKCNMHEEPNRSTRESRDACALPKEEREKHEMVVIDPDCALNDN